ncbi:TPA: IS3 family transposase [Bacillus pseudomycoides]|nr:IS3 family transposase [Bacillus pseudomycoides]
MRICQTLEVLQERIEDYTKDYSDYRNQWILEKTVPVQYRNHFLANICCFMGEFYGN